MRAAESLFRTMKWAGLRPSDRTCNTLMQGWIESKKMDRAMDLFNQMKRNKRARPTIVTYTLLITGWSRQMKRMDMAEKVMQELMNDRDVSPNDRTFGALIRGYNFLFNEDRNWRIERMYYWLCRMRDLRIKPTYHIVKTFNQMGIYFPGVDEPFWTTDFGMPFDPRRHGHRR